ncbi:hypothetical protein B0H19DRAFT_1245392 [Mycena capillaripes]|nr:hypothetical protein B0H19DRAFT_1245392 [Mycena capillaripes]
MKWGSQQSLAGIGKRPTCTAVQRTPTLTRALSGIRSTPPRRRRSRRRSPPMHPLVVEGQSTGKCRCARTCRRQAEDDERVDGTRAPAYDDTLDFSPDEEGSYSLDEAWEDKKVKRLVKRVKGRAKVIGGRISRDKEGPDMIVTT